MMTAMQQIEQLCAEARAHGMTYGEYIEKFNPQLGEPERISKKEKRVAETRKAVEERERKRIREQLRRKRSSSVPQNDTELRARCREFRSVEVVCSICGERFSAKRRDAKYCPGCTKKRRNEAVKRYMKRKKECPAG